MAKASITKKYTISASGILFIEDGVVGIESPETGEVVELKHLLDDFNEKSIRLSVTYDEDYGTEAE